MERMLALVGLVLVLAFGYAGGYPLAVRDDMGREVVLPAEPQRIVSMMPSHTETLCALDLCDRLVGRDTFSNFPEGVADLPDLGSPFNTDLERLLALEPDLVLVDEYSGLAGPLEALGLVVYAGTPQTFEEVFDFLLVAGVLFDRRDQAALLVGRLRNEVQAVAALAATGPAPRVYFELDATPYSVGPDGFIGTLIALAGGDNIVMAEQGEFPQLDPEFVVSADPEVIVLADAPFGESLASLRRRPGWQGIAAVGTGRVAELSAEQVDLVTRPGPRLVQGLSLLARIFHPGLF